LLLEIRVISPDGILRNSKLKTDILNLKIVHGYDGRVSNFENDHRIGQFSNEIVIGRRLSSTQAAAVLSHNKAQRGFNDDWACILEDDALILDIDAFTDALALISKMHFRNPTIVLLYSGYGGTYRKFRSISPTFSLSRVVALPTGAVGYVVNRSFQSLIENEKMLVGPPDWPTWSANVDFYQIYPCVVQHTWSFKPIYSAVSQKSDSNAWPNHRKSSKGAIKGLFRREIVLAYGGRRNYLKIVMYPGFNRRVSKIKR
jgi:GR25 family glycosyltransferase involved in LPS biosynthesis